MLADTEVQVLGRRKMCDECHAVTSMHEAGTSGQCIPVHKDNRRQAGTNLKEANMHDTLKVATSEDIARLQGQVDEHDSQLADIDCRLNDMEENIPHFRVDDIESRIDDTESRLDDVEYRLDNLDELYRVEELESVVADLTDSLKSALDTIENLRFLVVNTESRLSHLEQTARRRFTFRRGVK